MIAALAVGAVFVVGGALIRPRRRADELQARGTVVESWDGAALGDPANVCTVEFHDADGTAWRFQPPLTSVRRRAVGSHVAVAYSPADPQATARKADGLDAYLPWLVMGIGAVLAVCSPFLG